ncbi:hypothetical protein ACFSTC_48470 [Nonomuraea ferruginea]
MIRADPQHIEHPRQVRRRPPRMIVYGGHQRLQPRRLLQHLPDHHVRHIDHQPAGQPLPIRGKPPAGEPPTPHVGDPAALRVRGLLLGEPLALYGGNLLFGAPLVLYGGGLLLGGPPALYGGNPLFGGPPTP